MIFFYSIIFYIEKWLWKYNFGTFWGPGTMSIHKIQQFHLTALDFWAKTLLFRSNQARNYMKKLTLLNILVFVLFEKKCGWWNLKKKLGKYFNPLCFAMGAVASRYDLVPRDPLWWEVIFHPILLQCFSLLFFDRKVN